ncbi:MAG: pentapeptide repeat-containing protein [Spirochaetaceae bacterium]|nr:MAG: pentapeptide repeat-containing protein [Spirochaetaceae bacterium]
MFGQSRDQYYLESLPAPLIEYVDGRNKGFSGMDLTSRHLRWVRFTGSMLKDCDFRNSTLECFFADFALFENCHFDQAHIFESVFAGCRLINCSFTGVTADLCNFNGIYARDTDFSDASLRGSRFVNARLSTVNFVNCDVKDALFQFSQRNEVTFRHSNYEEACF